MTAVLVLSPRRPGVILPPEDLPFGRAALSLAARGIRVGFGSLPADNSGAVVALEARPGGWEESAEFAPDAVYDRFPSVNHPTPWQRARRHLASIPWGNSSEAMALCRDKLRSQRVLEAGGVAMPECEETRLTPATLTQWPAAFVKPRFGAFGIGVERIESGAAIKTHAQSSNADREETVIQRAILPPPLHYRGQPVVAISVRILVQSRGDAWCPNPPVARISFSDPVANVKDGAIAAPLTDVARDAGGPDLVTRATRLAVRAAQTLDHALRDEPNEFIEVGVDVVFDSEWAPYVIEVNGKPGGFLRALLADDRRRFADAHALACESPILALAARATPRGR